MPSARITTESRVEETSFSISASTAASISPATGTPEPTAQKNTVRAFKPAASSRRGGGESTSARAATGRSANSVSRYETAQVMIMPSKTVTRDPQGVLRLEHERHHGEDHPGHQPEQHLDQRESQRQLQGRRSAPHGWPAAPRPPSGSRAGSAACSRCSRPRSRSGSTTGWRSPRTASGGRAGEGRAARTRRARRRPGHRSGWSRSRTSSSAPAAGNAAAACSGRPARAAMIRTAASSAPARDFPATSWSQSARRHPDFRNRRQDQTRVLAPWCGWLRMAA